MGYKQTLRELAAAYSISSEYTKFGGDVVQVSDDTLLKTLKALGVELGTEASPSEEVLQEAIRTRADQEFTRPLPRCIVTTDAQKCYFNVHVHDGADIELSVRFEDGTVGYPMTQVENWNQPRTIDGITWGEASFELPAGLPQGWHTLTMVSNGVTDSCPLIVTPARLSTTDTYINQPVTGVMAQLYSVRSAGSWGIGDFHDLGSLGETIAESDAGDFLLINPLHAGEPFPPIEDSPYLPTSRRFINPIYIRIEDIPELALLDEDQLAEITDIAQQFQDTNRSADIIDRNPIYAAKLKALKTLFELGRDTIREQQFRDYIHAEGDGLAEFAQWCAIAELKANDHADIEELTDFYMWLQWICDSQLATAQARCVAAGMKIGIMADLAVGVHPSGSDAENLAEVLVPEASVGAPPDNYNQYGQDWSQPPWHPEKLAAVGYRPWRDMLRTVLRHSGGIRVDHVLGLFRLFWIPRMQEPATGTYVNYDFNALVGILVLEAERAGAVVIGEDLGTYEPWVQDVLASYGVMGTSVLWFESSPSVGGARLQEEYRPACLASVTTHDLPPTAGYLEGVHITLREELGLLPAGFDAENAGDLHWQAEILDRVLHQGGFAGEDFHMDSFHGRNREERGETTTLVAATHRFIAATPAALTCTALVDMVGDRKIQNQPGTGRDLYPNWCIPLSDSEGHPVLVEDLAANPIFQRVAEASRRR